MNDAKKISKSIAYSYGLILGLVTIATMVIMYAFDLEKNMTISILSAVITIAIVVYGIKNFKKANGDFLALRNALKVGLGICLIAGLIGAIYSFIHYTYIDPSFVENLREEAMRQSAENPDMDEKTLETVETVTNAMTSPLTLSAISIIGTLFFGFIISLITGLIMKNEKPAHLE